jgi:hypothetical protein
MSHRPRSGVEIAKRLGLPLDVYYQRVIFRANLIDGAGYVTELCGGNPSGAAFRISGNQFLFGVDVSADSLSVTVQRLHGGPSSRIFFAPGLPDTDTFRRAYSLIVDYDRGRPLPLRKCRVLRPHPLNSKRARLVRLPAHEPGRSACSFAS